MRRKQIIIFVVTMGIYCSSFGQDTSRISPIHQRLYPPDSLIFKIIYIERSDTLFSIAYYSSRLSNLYEYSDTLYFESKGKWRTKNRGDVYTIYHLKKTKEYNCQLNGYIYTLKRIVSYKKGKKISSQIFWGNWSYYKKFT